MGCITYNNSLDDRDKNGFWVPYKCHSVWGHFECPVDPCCSWKSHDVQVDILVRDHSTPFQSLIIYPLQLRFNFKLQRGEVKIDREYRQRCPAHGGPLVHPIVGAKSGAKWVMQRVMRFIRARFYTDRESSSRTRVKKSSSVSSSNTGSGTSLDSIESDLEFEVVRRRRPESRPLYRPQPDHNPYNCEACLLRRCPRPSR